LNFCDKCTEQSVDTFVLGHESSYFSPLSERQKNVIKIYWNRHTANSHKMALPPVCSVSDLRLE